MSISVIYVMTKDEIVAIIICTWHSSNIDWEWQEINYSPSDSG